MSSYNPDPGLRYLQGDELEPFRVPDSGRCWWCGGNANSQEHKFKRTDLTRMWSDEDHLIWICEKQQRKIRSARKSSIVKYPANMCSTCNNARSQPFDLAYDAFADFIWDRLDDLWKCRFLDMKSIYGESWQEDELNLARYFAKQIGCRMASAGFAVPPVIPTFLDGSKVLPYVQMALFKDPVLWDMYCRGKREGFAAAGLFLAPAVGTVRKSQKRLVMFSSSATIGYIGVMYRWDADVEEVDPFYVYRRARLHRRDNLPSE